MTAEIKAIQSNLTLLKDILPIETPLSLTVSVGNVCDFKCVYCNQHRKKEAHKFLTLEEFKIIVEHLKQFNLPLKQLSFVSSGETLLNKELPAMIKMAKTENVTERVKIITNASHLNKKCADELIAAGLDHIKISLQGLSAEAYEKVCGVNIEYDKFVNQIKYFYEHRKQCKVHIKIIDIGLETGEEENFYNQFGDIADSLFVEHCCDDSNVEDNKYFFAEDTKNTRYCPLPFYAPFIDEWLDVFPCCLINRDMTTPEQRMGNLKNNSLYEMWNVGFKSLWKDILNEKIKEGSICHECHRFNGFIRPEDIFDEKKTDILNKLD